MPTDELQLQAFELEGDLPSLWSWTRDMSERQLVEFSGFNYTWPLDEQQLRTAYEHNLADPQREVWVGVDAGGQMAGLVVLARTDTRGHGGYIGGVLVDPARRGQGLCTAMMAAVLELCFETYGLHRVTLNVNDRNSSAQRCYERVGFVVEGLQRELRYAGDELMSSYLMSVLAPDWRAAQPGQRSGRG